MDVQKWKHNWFTEFGHLPSHWTCPRCSGSLKLPKERVQYLETHSSIDERQAFGGEMRYIFTATAKCKSCDEAIGIVGNAADRHYEGDDTEGNWIDVEYTEHYPRYFYPPIHLFSLPKKLKDTKIQIEIGKSFSYFFNDTSASANKIRIVIELLLTEFYIKKFVINKKGERWRLSTHQRIDEFSKTRPDEAKLMLAIKWIGNEGSHDGADLSHEDLLDGFELLEHILEKMYEDKAKRLMKKAEGINKRKGVKKKRKH